MITALTRRLPARTMALLAAAMLMVAALAAALAYSSSGPHTVAGIQGTGSVQSGIQGTG